jgi:preprotein translocase subunit SecB
MPQLRDENLAGVRMDWVFVRELVFRDPLPASAKPVVPEALANLSLENVVAEDGNSCTNRLTIDLALPGSDGPFVRAVVEASFTRASDKSAVDIRQFAAEQGPAIVMPFLRDAVATATSKSRYGQILIAPINVMSLAPQPGAVEASATIAPK